jgi:hypothetical protein
MKKSSKRTDRVRYVDPATGVTEYRYVEKVTYRYDEEEKVPIVIEFLTGETTAEKMVEKYHICSVQTLYAWVGRYVSQENLLSLQNQISDDMANRSKDDQIRELKAALKKAQKEAELEKLRAKAYDKMIDLAEERFNIPIRKKSGTKQ